MTSRDKILAAVQNNQPPLLPLPQWDPIPAAKAGTIEAFRSVLEGIGGSMQLIGSLEEVNVYIAQHFSASKRVFSMVPGIHSTPEGAQAVDVHRFHDVELAVIKGHFGVAENGAVWITEESMGDRALPFICQHLAVVIPGAAMVATMHEAYTEIGDSVHGFGTFIAGPSKTADIEQSLVLGAHGPKTMTVFLLQHAPG